MSDESDLGESGYIVIALSSGIERSKYEGCKIIPEDERYPATYKHCYGPRSEKECEKWMAAHCDK
ncbi:MAG TPA: hypothetical protein VNZ44_01590 [Pyrinomonadaceae bacterium]|nr:hypothetical protein [Pyrinomonadaceae bacterium]